MVRLLDDNPICTERATRNSPKFGQGAMCSIANEIRMFRCFDKTSRSKRTPHGVLQSSVIITA